MTRVDRVTLATAALLRLDPLDLRELITVALFVDAVTYDGSQFDEPTAEEFNAALENTK